ncbi:hypothetical protein AKJ59_00255 [candidate division MSBL1 archaeon SCGC-AAA385M02]|uniref:Uncharacterized protein n=1 Tax=candidate division MSBL1 archaeon SCGC-AAA385M02 TaxID=1698287 RepID=A0A133VR90_9EURY|nr:hypothetical protein AKJ59_00255 [candidate division MSBL1 archaeon SCGC-AAA385M02]
MTSITDKINFYLQEKDKSGVNMRKILDEFEKAKNEKEFDVIYNEMGKDSTEIGKLFKGLNDTAKKTLMDKINKIKDNL